jgi:hypothetical protein
MNVGIAALKWDELSECLNLPYEIHYYKTTGDNAISLTELWKNYNFRYAIESIHHAWQQITTNNTRGIWKHILPHFANSSDFKEETVTEEITNTGRKLGLVDKKMKMFGNCSIHTQEELTDDDLLLLDQQRACEEADNDAKE